MIYNNTQEQQQNNLKQCYSCGESVSSRRELTNHRKNQHFKEKWCRFYHGNGAPCRFPDSECIDIHGSRQHPQQSQPQEQQHHQPQDQQPQHQQPQRRSVIQQNSQYRKTIPCRDGSKCGWANSQEGCRYLHSHDNTPATTAVNNDQLKELTNLIQAGLNIRENQQTRPVPDINSLTDFPGEGYSKVKSDKRRKRE